MPKLLLLIAAVLSTLLKVKASNQLDLLLLYITEFVPWNAVGRVGHICVDEERNWLISNSYQFPLPAGHEIVFQYNRTSKTLYNILRPDVPPTMQLGYVEFDGYPYCPLALEWLGDDQLITPITVEIDLDDHLVFDGHLKELWSCYHVPNDTTRITEAFPALMLPTSNELPSTCREVGVRAYYYERSFYHDEVYDDEEDEEDEEGEED